MLKMGAKIGDVIRTEMPTPGEFGRMAAMTAKQVITQKLREAEREIIFSEFKEFEGQIINATVTRREGKVVLSAIFTSSVFVWRRKKEQNACRSRTAYGDKGYRKLLVCKTTKNGTA